jgi:hypothetical protein
MPPSLGDVVSRIINEPSNETYERNAFPAYGNHVVARRVHLPRVGTQPTQGAINFPIGYRSQKSKGAVNDDTLEQRMNTGRLRDMPHFRSFI